jgi:hypothetical protein
MLGAQFAGPQINCASPDRLTVQPHKYPESPILAIEADSGQGLAKLNLHDLHCVETLRALGARLRYRQK